MIGFLGEGPTPTGPLYALSVPDRLSISITIESRGTSGWQRCEVSNSSWYFGCNGARLWSSQDISIMKKLFQFTTRGVAVRGYFEIRVRNDNSPTFKTKIHHELC